MKIYKISQDRNRGYDTYDSAVVIAKSKVGAKRISPSEFYKWKDGEWHFLYADGRTEPDTISSWVDDLEFVKVEYLGEAKRCSKEGVVCASFNAG